MDQLDIQVVREQKPPRQREAPRVDGRLLGVFTVALVGALILWLGSQTPAQELPATTTTTAPASEVTQPATPPLTRTTAPAPASFSILRWLELGHDNPPEALSALDGPLWLVLGPGVRGRYLVALNSGRLEFERLRCAGTNARDVVKFANYFLFSAGGSTCVLPSDLSGTPEVVEGMAPDPLLVATSGDRAWICENSDDRPAQVVGYDLATDSVEKVTLPSCPLAASEEAFLVFLADGINTYWWRRGDPLDVATSPVNCVYAGRAASFQLCRADGALEIRTDAAEIIHTLDVDLPDEGVAFVDVSSSGSNLLVHYASTSVDIGVPESPVLVNLETGESQVVVGQFNFAPGAVVSLKQVATLQFAVNFCPSCDGGSLVLKDLGDGSVTRLFKFPDGLGLTNVAVFAS